MSLLIAILAAYTSFSHRHLMQQAVSALSYRLWLSSGSVAMGLGVWAMHFTGMMSLQLPVEVGYQLSLTLLSVLPAIAAAFVTLNVVAADVQQCLTTYQLEPQQLMLELTESLILADLDDAVSRMQQIKQMGVRFSMDDFGTGYSSLSYLSRLPFDEVKIDQYFVRSASSGKPRDWVIVEAIIGIANTFGMKLIAEGVETEVQRELLRQSGCYCYQGYLFAKPARAAEIASWITGHAQSD